MAMKDSSAAAQVRRDLADVDRALRAVHWALQTHSVAYVVAIISALDQGTPPDVVVDALELPDLGQVQR
jgi:hypothetical protein